MIEIKVYHIGSSLNAPSSASVFMTHSDCPKCYIGDLITLNHGVPTPARDNPGGLVIGVCVGVSDSGFSHDWYAAYEQALAAAQASA